MLEIRNVTKVYRSKTGEEVKALDNVSITFPESGMVFILGKSGSGKSTLLNVMGGLDSYDEGEFIIKGKSSNEFVGSDFDAYRNTFIGFIFQEYNVLDDFTVGANIGLALELQGKKATDEAINGILEQVDLLNYAKRKPNELSGGQKQRVAIARALVKEPEIIMADEPTGALDSNTGKQIFDTLKELSKTKLVLIVSHDRDFAERYADRIVELADGKIIEDVTKHEHRPEQISAGVHRINDNILRIESGYKLTAADLEMINAYLAKNQGDVLLSGDGRVNEELRSAVGISKDGATTVFEGTDPATDIKTRSYEKGKTKFIRSRLPMKNAVKMGTSSLKHKKFRLFMTILLSFISFAMFGLSSSLAAYEKISAATNSIIDSEIRSAAMTLGVRRTTTWDDGDSYTTHDGQGLNADDIAWLEQQTGLDFVPVFTGQAYSDRWNKDGAGFKMSHLMSNYSSNTVYTGKMAGLVSIGRDQLPAEYGLVGEFPKQSGEIVITDFLYRQFNQYGFDDGTTAVQAGALTKTGDGSANDIIGKTITIEQIGWQMMPTPVQFKIVGVVDTHFNYDRYANLLPVDQTQSQHQQQAGVQEETTLMDMFLAEEVTYEVNFGFHALGFTLQEDIDALTPYMATNMGYKEFGQYMSAGTKSLRLIAFREAKIEGDQPDRLTEFYRVATIDELKTAPIKWFEEGKTTLGANEILISRTALNNLLPEQGAIVFDADAFNQMGVATYGADVWNHTAITSNEGRSYYDQLVKAEMIAYIRATVPLMSDEDMQFNFSTNNSSTAETAWITRWVQNGGSMSIKLGGEYIASDEVQKKAFERAGVQAYAANFYGITLPTHVKTELIQNALNFLYNSGPNQTEGNEYLIGRGGLYWISEMYAYSDAVQHEVWNNPALEAQLLKDEYNGYKNSDWQDLSAEQKKNELIQYYCGRENSIKEQLQTYNYVELEQMRIAAYMKACGFTQDKLLENVYFQFTESENGNDDATLETPGYKVVGVFDTASMIYGDPNNTVVSAEIFAYFETWAEENADSGFYEMDYKEDRAEHEDGIWAFVVAPISADDTDAIQKLVELSYADPDTTDLLFEMQNAVMYTLGNFNEIIETLAQVFVWVGLGLALFSSFMLMNFISTSISYKKREIGILRAVGARSSDVFKIFFSEAFVIAFINFLLATAASLTTVIILNNYMRNSGINITLLSFGPLQVLLMLGVSILVAALASFLPVWKIARKKPVDAIKDR